MIKDLLSDGKSAFLFTDSVALRYFTGVKIDEGFLVLSNKATCFTDARYFYAAKQALNKKGIDCVLYDGLHCVKEFLLGTGAKRLYLDFDKTTLSEYNKYKDFGLELLDGTSAFYRQRCVKRSDEIESIKKACAITQRAFYDAVGKLKVGMTELEFAKLIDDGCTLLGAEKPAFNTIVAFGEHSAVPHHQTGNTPLVANTVILVDTGCVVNGYCSDYTRTFYFGKPSEKFIKSYDAVLQANLLATKSIKVGTSTVQADGFARSYLDGLGVAKYFTHSLGHGVGMEVHEVPTLSPRLTLDSTLKQGMVFSIEPGLYYDGEFGIRIEDTVVLTNGGVQRLFTDEKNLMII